MIVIVPIIQIDDYLLTIEYEVTNTPDKWFCIKKKIYSELDRKRKKISERKLAKAKSTSEVYEIIEEDQLKARTIVEGAQKNLRELEGMLDEEKRLTRGENQNI